MSSRSNGNDSRWKMLAVGLSQRTVALDGDHCLDVDAEGVAEWTPLGAIPCEVPIEPRPIEGERVRDKDWLEVVREVTDPPSRRLHGYFWRFAGGDEATAIKAINFECFLLKVLRYRTKFSVECLRRV